MKELKKPVHDISATPEFVLGYISFIFVFYVVLFAVIAFCLMMTVGLMEATQRAFMLSHNHLLPPRLKALWFFFRSWELPEILATAAEVFLVCSGLLVYAWADSLFICICAIFGPILAGL